MFMEIYQMGVELFRADRRTYGRIREETDVFLQCLVNAPTNETLS